MARSDWICRNYRCIRLLRLISRFNATGFYWACVPSPSHNGGNRFWKYYYRLALPLPRTIHPHTILEGYTGSTFSRVDIAILLGVILSSELGGQQTLVSGLRLELCQHFLLQLLPLSSPVCGDYHLSLLSLAHNFHS